MNLINVKLFKNIENLQLLSKFIKTKLEKTKIGVNRGLFFCETRFQKIQDI